MAMRNEDDNTLRQRAIDTARYLRDEFGTTQHRLNIRMSRRRWVLSAAVPLVSAFVLGRYTAPQPDRVQMSDEVAQPTAELAKPTQAVAAKPAEAPTSVSKPAQKPTIAPSSPKPAESPAPKPSQIIVETPGIKTAFAEATKAISSSLPQDVIDAIQKGGARAYAGFSAPGKFPLIRRLEYSPTSTDQIVARAQNGTMFMKTFHPAVLSEYEYLTQMAGKSPAIRATYLEQFAHGVLDGLTSLYDPKAMMVLALEAGHQSNAPRAIVDAKIKDRRDRGIQTPLADTEDTGASVVLPSGEILKERKLNHELSQLIAMKALERTSWVPVLNCPEDGFEAGRFLSLVDSDRTYITHKDSIVMMRYKWEWLAEQLQNAGINMIRISNHFNGGTATSRDGFFVPQNARFKDVSEQFAAALASAVQKRVRQIQPDYVNIMNSKINDCDKQPFWMIDSKDDDNPADVRNGNVSAVMGATNGILARIRSAQLGLSDGRDPFPSC